MTEPVLQERYLPTPQRMLYQGFLPLSLRPYMLQGGLTLKPSNYNDCPTRGEGEDGKVWHQKWPAQGC